MVITYNPRRPYYVSQDPNQCRFILLSGTAEIMDMKNYHFSLHLLAIEVITVDWASTEMYRADTILISRR